MRIHCSNDTYLMLMKEERFIFKSRGTIDVKVCSTCNMGFGVEYIVHYLLLVF